MKSHLCVTHATPHSTNQNRQGSILVLTAMTLVMVFAFTAFAIDIGYILMTENELQTCADSAAMAAAAVLGNGDSSDQSNARQMAIEYSNLNSSNSQVVLNEADIQFGNWDSETKSFTVSNSSPNSIQVTTQRSTLRNNPLPLFFAPIIGHQFADVTATSIVTVPPSEGGPQFRFLLDDEMFDSDEEDIEDLADSLGKDSDEILYDNNNDGFIDLPAGAQLELPTGQEGDEGMFDITSYDGAFPFQEDTYYTMTDFLAESTALEDILDTRKLQDVEWKKSNAPQKKLKGNKVLDPVTGVDPMDSHSAIRALPDPDTISLSPLYKSDVSMAETDTSKYGSPAANLQGERRGLVAYKIISSRNNPAGGSYLPMLTVEIVDPNDIDFGEVTMDGSGGGSSSSSSSPQLVY